MDNSTQIMLTGLSTEEMTELNVFYYLTPLLF